MRDLLGGLPVIESPGLPLRPSPREEARRIVRHGMRDVLEWLEMEVGPAPGEITHAVMAMDPANPGGRMLYASKELIEKIRARARMVDCQRCGEPTDPQDPQPCEEGGLCIPEDPELMALWAENDERLAPAPHLERKTPLCPACGAYGTDPCHL